MPVVKTAFTYRFGHGGTIEVPAGAPLIPNVFDGPDWFWVDDRVFPRGSIEQHDAHHYGVRVHVDNTTEAEEVQ